MSTDILARVKKVIAKSMDIDPDAIQEDSNFTEDLGADSLSLVELIMSFEEEFGVDIPDSAAEGIKTVKDAIDYIKSQSPK